MSSSSVQVQPQPSGATKGVTSPTGSTPGSMNFDIVRCSRCQRSMSLENESSPGVCVVLCCAGAGAGAQATRRMAGAEEE
ncbi:hypothetical protein BDQ94DRAFT_164408 [Aspergillus welwitschiae]|uniref:Uncharacterized protein n=2 Tax=Aspergillus TaxID=5052 RepID=A0A3F3PHW1_9EURO|nr:hypothetical protein BDQ94DRAFT_164408 [Aspergillus welwitschiae]RDH26544.1 hypothetical protein BDQ94DRAFT_164408 [Aspergillus welwitschiae]RDK46203.1 hypothetical protein M752DRAFT_289730 [Aspergillus phoenicis ATCC 13157]